MCLQHTLVRLRLIHAQVREKLSALSYFAQKSAACGVVLAVLLKVIGQKSDFCSKNGDLNLRRTGVLRMGAMICNQLLLLGALECHTSRVGKIGKKPYCRAF